MDVQDFNTEILAMHLLLLRISWKANSCPWGSQPASVLGVSGSLDPRCQQPTGIELNAFGISHDQ